MAKRVKKSNLYRFEQTHVPFWRVLPRFRDCCPYFFQFINVSLNVQHGFILKNTHKATIVSMEAANHWKGGGLLNVL